MRTLPADFAAHLASGATTLATCWRLVRRDGTVLGFTDHDRLLRFEDTDFAPMHGLEGGETAQKLGAQTDTAEVVGILDAEAIRAEDIRLGRYDGASVETFRVNWRDPGQRVLLRHDRIGEIIQEDGRFRAELRSEQQGLAVRAGRSYQPVCDAALGDARCGVDLDDPAFSAEAAVLAVRDRYRLAVGGLAAFRDDWFVFGRARWLDGVRQGLVDRLVGQSREGEVDILAFDAPVGDWVLPGDRCIAAAGCDRRFATCRAKFANAVNFRGFPHIPGNDFVLRYPREGDGLDGRPLVP